MADHLGWRWEFGVQVPVLLLCVTIAWIVIPDDLGIEGERKGVWQALKEFDAKGSLLLTTSITFGILSLVSLVKEKRTVWIADGYVEPWRQRFSV